MNITLPQSLVLGFVSGLLELLPIAPAGGRAILQTFFDLPSEQTMLLIMIRLGCLTSLIAMQSKEIAKLRRVQAQLRLPSRRGKHPAELSSVFTIRMLRLASIVVVLGKILLYPFRGISMHLGWVALATVLCSSLVLLPRMAPSGNKDSRNLSPLDGLLLGLSAAASGIPGVSQLGVTVSVGTLRGMDRGYVLKFACLLMIPGLLADLGLDVMTLILNPVAMEPVGLLICLAGGVVAAAGGWVSQKTMDFLSYQAGFSGLSYPGFAVALACFWLFLTV